MSYKWYVARTYPRAEMLAASLLEREGIKVYCPLVVSQIPSIAGVRSPLFPGYLFLHCDAEGDAWPVLRPEQRVLGWLRLDGEIPALADEVVSELQNRVKSLNQNGGIWRRYRPGEMVRVASGSMESMAKILEEPKSPSSRVKVLLKFMGRMVHAQVPWESLSPVAGSATAKHRLPRRTRGRGRRIRTAAVGAAATG